MNYPSGQFNRIDKKLSLALRILYKIPYYLLVLLCVWVIVDFFVGMKTMINENKYKIEECVINTEMLITELTDK